MATNIDTGLTVADALNADHSPHIFTMSNGDLLAIYYDGTNLVWRSKSGGAWSAKTALTLDTAVAPPQVSYFTRNGDTLLGVVSKDPIDGTHNGDFLQLTYTTATHTLALTNKQLDAADGAEKAAGIGYTSGATANNQVQVLHGNAAGNFATVQQLNVNPTIFGTDQVPTFTDYRSSARTGLVTDGTTTTYLIYAIASTGTAFKVERFVTSVSGNTVESPPAPAANLAGVTGVWDGTNYVFIANENNAKLRYLKRTGANTYGTWTDILSDASLTGQPAVCVKSNGDLALFYRTNKNQANGEIWVVQRTGGTWGSPSLLAGGAATGWSNPSCAASDLNDTGVARLVYVTGTASTWTLVEDSYTFTTGGTPVAIAGQADGVGTASLTPTVSHLVSGTATGAGTASLTLTVAHPLTAQADGTGGATLSLTVAHLLSGQADGVGVATLTLAGAGVQVAGQANGASTASLSLTVAHLISGTASGASTATCTLTVAHLVTAQADGIGVATLALFSVALPAPVALRLVASTIVTAASLTTGASPAATSLTAGTGVVAASITAGASPGAQSLTAGSGPTAASLTVG